MSVRISLSLEACEMFLSLHMIFSLERAAVVWAILERILGFDPSLEMRRIASMDLKIVKEFIFEIPISSLIVRSYRLLASPCCVTTL